MLRGDRSLFEGLNLSLRPGRAVHLKGPNGSGKTTLLRILCGLLWPSEGELRMSGRAIAPSDPSLRGLAGFLGHADALKLELDVVENLQFARTLGGHPPLSDPLPLLARLGLAAQATLEARRLSAGQRRRLGIARMMACEHRIWILDEPFTALDTQGIELLSGILEQVLDQNRALIFTSHQLAPLSRHRLQILELAPA